MFEKKLTSKTLLALLRLKCLWNKIFYYLIRKSFQIDEEWLLFYCDSTLGCRVIQDFDLCKFRWLVTSQCGHSGVKSQKSEYLSHLFLYRTDSCYTHHKVPWHVYCDISMATPFKGENQSFPPSFALVVHSVGVSEYGHYTASNTTKFVKLWSNK